MNINYIKLSLNQLLLDPNNYRLDYDAEAKEYPDQEIPLQKVQHETQELLEKEKLGELRESILQNGFLEMDRIVVRKLTTDNNLFVVVEGNRRTAALKGLISDYREGTRDLPGSLLEKMNSIEVVWIDGTSEEVAKYSAALMGIRHVSGPKKWSGYQSARLINDRHNKGQSLTEIGSLLGITSIDAGRRLRGYKAYIQMKNDEEYGKKCTSNHYTLLLEFLAPGQSGKQWLEWDDKTFEFKNKNNLHRLYQAITPNESMKPEIKNPNEAREFQVFLSSNAHREMIEEGVKMNDLPPVSKGDNFRLKEMKDFLYLINEIKYNEISDHERDLLKKISERILLMTKEVTNNE